MILLLVFPASLAMLICVGVEEGQRSARIAVGTVTLATTVIAASVII
jgi:hypothetical protein